MAEAISYKCLACGGPMEFTPGTEQIVCEYLNKSGYNDRPNGGTLLLLAMQNRKWYFVTDPKMQKVLLDQYATKKIEKKLVPNMKNGKVADACEAYLDVVDNYTAHYLEKGSAYSDADPPPKTACS